MNSLTRQQSRRTSGRRRRGWVSLLGAAALLGSFLYGTDVTTAPAAHAGTGPR
ncbi:hypothetical protein [Streptomyces sp. NBC_01497]|uniref:hypothetical protein n=1 Tax=Streptomyces sp. NBC_01497 TaxID=2903885 RepID=UPI002E346102|nr:hypothetical protein [Streptomyces sp. NBC_01497]